MLANKDIVIVSQQSWDTDIGSNIKNLAVEFSKSYRILFVNPPLDRITMYRQRKDEGVKYRRNVIDGRNSGMIEIKENLWSYYPDVLIESINWIGIEGLFRYLNKRNNIAFASCIKAALEILNFSNFILFNDNDIFRSFHLKELLKPSISIYYSRDNIVATDYWRRHGKSLEPLLIEKSDLCLANSEFLQLYCSTFNKSSYFVGQGCEIALFNRPRYVKPSAIEGVNGTVIGYIGAITSMRLDIELIKYMAKAQPDWNIVLVGPQDKHFERSNLALFPNVHIVGKHPPHLLPNFIEHFDVCINPQLLNEMTIGNYPRKIDEYLAMGKPVVATETNAMLFFRDYVFLAKSYDDFVFCIKRALETDSEQLIAKRKKFVANHSWESVVGDIYWRINQRLIELSVKQTATS